MQTQECRFLDSPSVSLSLCLFPSSFLYSLFCLCWVSSLENQRSLPLEISTFSFQIQSIDLTDNCLAINMKSSCILQPCLPVWDPTARPHLAEPFSSLKVSVTLAFLYSLLSLYPQAEGISPTLTWFYLFLSYSTCFSLVAKSCPSLLRPHGL